MMKKIILISFILVIHIKLLKADSIANAKESIKAIENLINNNKQEIKVLEEFVNSRNFGSQLKNKFDIILKSDKPFIEKAKEIKNLIMNSFSEPKLNFKLNIVTSGDRKISDLDKRTANLIAQKLKDLNINSLTVNFNNETKSNIIANDNDIVIEGNSAALSSLLDCKI